MSRSGYSHDYDCTDWEIFMWRGAVASAIRGRRGQNLLREMVEAMEAMPVKELIAHELEQEGQYCALGTVGKRRGLDMTGIDPDCSEQVAGKFDIANAMACEVAFINDEGGFLNETPGQRWQRVYKWANSKIRDSMAVDVHYPEAAIKGAKVES